MKLCAAFMLFVLFSIEDTYAADPVTFNSPAVFPAAAGATADFNHDGIPDYAGLAPSNDGLAVQVTFGHAAGSFSAGPVLTPSVPDTTGANLAVGDLNGDGYPDVVVATSLAIYVWFGTAIGQFSTPSTYLVDLVSNPSVLLADVNGDGDLDVVLVAHPSTSVFVSFGSPTGQLGPVITANLFLTGPCNGAALGDLNGDGRIDIALSCADGAYWAPGDGRGQFGAAILLAPVASSTGGGGGSTVIADFNCDGIPDIAALLPFTTTTNQIAVLLGSGGGAFTKALPIRLSQEDVTMIAADLNGDGKPDLILGQPLELFLNMGSGHFTRGAENAYVAGQPIATDFNQDGKTDIVVGEGLDFVALAGAGDGTLAQQARVAQGVQPIFVENPAAATKVATADFNRDGYPDIVIVGANLPGTEYGFSILNGTADGSLTLNFNNVMLSPNPSVVKVADINNDGNADLVIGFDQTGNIALQTWLGTKSGGFEAAGEIRGISGGIYNLAVGDLNGDGFPDIAAVTVAGIAILLNGGHGYFEQPFSVSLSGIGNLGGVLIADVNGDGVPDLVLVSNSGVYVALNAGNAKFDLLPQNIAPAGYYFPDSVAIGDFNGDGILDLAILAPGLESGPSLFIDAGAGDGRFTQIHSYGFGSNATQLEAADFNGDGILDLIASDTAGVYVAEGQGDGSFTDPYGLPATGSLAPSAGYAVADFNGDGKLDVFVAGIGNQYVPERLYGTLLLNTTR